MTKRQLCDAMNRAAIKAGIYHWTPITEIDVLFATVQLPNLVAVLWFKQYPEDDDTRLLREQLNNLWIERGGLLFDEESDTPPIR